MNELLAAQPFETTEFGPGPINGGWGPERRHGRHGRLLALLLALLVSILVAILGIWLASSPSGSTLPAATKPAARIPGSGKHLGAIAWPSAGEAAAAVSGNLVGTSGGGAAVPIASLAKMMTVYVVLADHPNGLELRIDQVTADDTARRARRGESTVPVEVGEELTERQALLAILLPSANNIAAAVARRDAGSIGAFVERMNATARRLGMDRTRYTDPSGYDPSTVSTARDQLRLTYRAMLVPAFAGLVALREARVPVAGTITNIDTLLGHDGFVGVKTGSDNAAGGCFAFARVITRNGRAIQQLGVVLGQRHGPFVPAALAAARTLADSLDAR